MCGPSTPDTPKPKPIKPKPSTPAAAPQMQVDPAQMERVRKAKAKRYVDTSSASVKPSSSFASTNSVPSLLEI